jgi:hypothetical protein
MSLELAKPQLRLDLTEALLTETPNPTPQQKASAWVVAGNMANAINAFVGEATVVSAINPSGTIVSTTIT